MKTISLSKGYEALVDDDDYDWLLEYKWHALKGAGSREPYAATNIKIDGKWKRAWMHKILLNAGSDQVVDHIDGNTLNNQKSNLRLATKTQNQQNRRGRRDSKSGYKGVSYESRKGYWRARIKVNGKLLSLGSFATPEEAHEAYKTAALKYFGEFSRW